MNVGRGTLGRWHTDGVAVVYVAYSAGFGDRPVSFELRELLTDLLPGEVVSLVTDVTESTC